MSYYLSPIGNSQFVDTNGAPLSGGFLWSYAAGTTTPITTYADDAGTPQTNPIVLNSAGRPTLGPVWLDGGQAVKFVLQNAQAVPLYTWDDVTGVNDPAAVAQDQWVIYTGAVTYSSAVAFTVAGDQTGFFQVGRRMRAIVTGGTAYGTVAVSSYNAGTQRTTVGYLRDSISLDAGLSQVSVGLLSVNDPSFVALRSAGAVTTTSGTTVDFTAIPPWVKRITLCLAGVSTTGTDPWLVQLGDAGGIENSGYICTGANITAAAAGNALYTAGFGITIALASAVASGRIVLDLLDKNTNTWVCSGQLGRSDAAVTLFTAGSKALSATLDRIRLTTSAGTDTFDAGIANILYE